MIVSKSAEPGQLQQSGVWRQDMDNTPTAPQPAAALATPLLHYHTLSKLGQGGYGEVYAAWDSKLRRQVAIKRLKATDRPRHRNSLLREARMAASLRHPAFVQIFAIEEDGGNHAIVMELIRGQTWRDLTSAHQPALRQALAMIRQLAEAMEAAHASGLVHGDLKPSNLMLDPAGKVRILDLGLASHESGHTTTSSIGREQPGTIAYMAPERLLGMEPNRQSDIYAVGVMLYEFLTNTLPFGKLSGLALAAAQIQQPSSKWTFPAGVPSELIDLVRAMTASRPEQRLRDMRAIIDTLDNYLRRGSSRDAAMGDWRNRRHPRAKLWALLLVPFALLSGAAIMRADWRSPASVPQDSAFSTSARLNQALRDLHYPDRPDRLDAADKGFTTVLDNDGDNTAAMAGLSLVYSFRYAGDAQDETWLQRAAAAAQQALQIDAQVALAHVAQAWVLAQQGSNEAAVTECELALKLDPDNFLAAVGKTIFLTKLRRFDAALTWVTQAGKRHPGQRLLADALGTIHYARGQYGAAEQAFRRSIQLEPDSVTGYANLNAVLQHEQRRDEALSILQQGLHIRPSATLYTNLGNALFLGGDYRNAADAFRRAVTPPTGNPNNYLAWANLADTLLWVPGHSRQAALAYERARQLLAIRLQRTPNDVTLTSRASLYAARSGAAQESIALLKQAIRLAPDDAYVRFRAGLAYELLGHRDAALGEIAQAHAAGYPSDKINAEPDLVSLRRDPRFQPNQTKE